MEGLNTSGENLMRLQRMEMLDEQHHGRTFQHRLKEDI